MATLVVVLGPAQGQKFSLGHHQLVIIGRDHDATFQILDGRISRYHLQLKRLANSDVHAAVDFNSANGVHVNDHKISAETVLHDGDVIRIGDTSILYSIKDEPDAQTITQLMRKHGEGRYKTMIEPPAQST